MNTHRFDRAQVTDSILEPLVDRALRHDLRAWQQLIEVIYPGLALIAGRWRVTSRLCDREDERDNVVLAVMERLHADELARLKLLHQVLRCGNDGGWPWIVTVASHTAVSYVRSHPENLSSRAPDGERAWVGFVPLAEGVEDLLPASTRCVYTAEAREIMAQAGAFLSQRQLRALRLWLVGWEFVEIARKMRLENGHAADLLVRSAVNALRRRFGKDEPETIFSVA